MRNFKPSTEIRDVAVIGAGAAGLMTAITAARQGLSVWLLDSQSKIGAKILMSGGTRCNVTNRDIAPADYNSDNIRFVRNVLKAFPSSRTINFFNDLGVELVMEKGGKFYPQTHSGHTILDALLGEVGRQGINLQTGCKVTRVVSHEGSFLITSSAGRFSAKTVVICAGGLSYPGTGSDGAGYRLAQSFGHSKINTIPALTPFTSADLGWRELRGVALPCILTLWAGNKKYRDWAGDMLFTHFGFSGLCILDASRHWLRLRETGTVKLTVNFLAQTSETDFQNELMECARKHPQTSVKNCLARYFPERFVVTFLRKIDVPAGLLLGQWRKLDRDRVRRALFCYELPVTGVVGYDKAEVTAGGINLTEINDQTMESRLRPGLFFAGEIVDADGRIGGFNFQWAWASGFVAANGAARRLKSEV